MKLIVDIAKVDWPHFYPDFFPQIMQLIQDQVCIYYLLLNNYRVYVKIMPKLFQSILIKTYYFSLLGEKVRFLKAENTILLKKIIENSYI